MSRTPRPGAPPPEERTRSGFQDVVKHVSDPMFRHGYTLVLNTALSSGLGMAYWLLAARLVPPSQVGLNATLISSFVFLAGLAQLNLRPVLSRFVPVAGRRTFALVAGAYGSSLAAAAVAGVVFIVGSPVWAPGGPIPSLRTDLPSAAGFVAATMLWTIFALQDGVLVGLRHTVLVTAENVLFGVAKIALLAGLVGWVGRFDYAIVASWLAPMAAAVTVVTVLLAARLIPVHARRRAPPGPGIGPAGLARFAAADYAGSLFALTYIALLPVLVIDRIGAEAGGRFYIVWVIASSLQLIAPQLVVSLTVETAADPTSLRRQGRRLLLGMLRILVPLCVALVVLAPVVLSIFGPVYASESTLLRLLVLSILPYSINVLFMGVARVAVRPRRIVLMQAALAVLILSLTAVLLEPLGLNAVGVAFLVGHGTLAMLALATSLRPLLTRGSPAHGDRST